MNDGHKSAIFGTVFLILHIHPSLKTHILFYRLSSTVCPVYYRYWTRWRMQVCHFLIWSSWHFWRYIPHCHFLIWSSWHFWRYIPHWNHTFRFHDITHIKVNNYDSNLRLAMKMTIVNSGLQGLSAFNCNHLYIHMRPLSCQILYIFVKGLLKWSINFVL